MKQLYDDSETGHVVKPRSEFLGRPRTLNLEDLHYIPELVHHHPDWFLDEPTGLMESNRFISVHYTTIHRELVRAGVSLTKLCKIAKERNEDLRADFKRRMAQYLPHELMPSRAESRSLCTKTGDDPVDEEELENDPEDMIVMVSSSDSSMYSELLYVWDL